MASNVRSFTFQKGALMFEVLVSLFIVVTVFVGQISLQVFVQKNTAEVSQRSQAIAMMNNMADRITSNRGAAGCYAFTSATQISPFLGHNGTSPTACAGFGDLQTQAIALADLTGWERELLGSSGVDSSNNNIQNIRNAKGCISVDDSTVPPTYTIAVAWESTEEQVAPLSRCGQGTYGNEAVRRAVETQVQFASLDAS